MRKVCRPGLVAVFFFVLVTYVFASTPITPTTTLAVETGNNTSAADTFQGQPNGNPAPGNVSKVDTRSLLYPGASTNIYAHYMPWFGTASHVNVGYSSTDPGQIRRQVDDMISRGIQGVVIDWYGPGTNEDTSSQLMLREAEARGGFSVAIMEDAGALKGCGDCTGALINHLNYVAQMYQGSPAYMRMSGRPVVFYFGVEALPINWSAVRANVTGNPLFIFENAGGFSYTYSDGGFSWVGLSGDANNWAQGYLDGFYQAGLSNPGKHTVGSAKKGFNDSIAAWTGNRLMNQNCGQTWLNTFGEIGRFYSAGRQLESLQLVTWNDYEEGSPIEMGIDNCVSIAASASGSTVRWSVGGNESTLDHYTVFISSDGQSLMPVTDVATGVRSLDLGQFEFNAGSYTAYVKAVGKPSLFNHMSGPVTVALNGSGVSGPAPTGDIGVGIDPSNLTVKLGQSGNVVVSVTPMGGFNSSVTLSCANLPPGVNCSFDHATMMPAGGGSTARLAISTNATALARVGGLGAAGLAFWLPGLGLGSVLLVERRRAKRFWLGLLAIVVMAVLASTGCGTGSTSAASKLASSKAAAKTGTYRIVINATSGSLQRSTSASLTIE